MPTHYANFCGTIASGIGRRRIGQSSLGAIVKRTIETYLRNDIYIELEGKNFSRQNTVPGRCASSLSIFTIILREHPIDKMGTYRDEK